MSGWNPVVLLAALACALLVAPATAAERFDVVTLTGPGRIDDLVRADLDGDGKQEILLLCGRRAVIHAPRKGVYDGKFPWRLDLAPDALCLDVGGVDAVPETKEIVLLTPGGVLYHALRDGRPALTPTTLIRATSLAAPATGGAPHRRSFLRDLDGDGLTDVVLPTPGGYALFFQGPDADGVAAGRWPKAADRVIPFTVRSTFSVGSPGLTGAVRARITLPEFRVLDLTGDGSSEFLLDTGRDLTVFSAGEDGRVDPTAPRRVVLPPAADAPNEIPHLLIRDLTGDGAPELLVVYRRAGIVHLVAGGSDPASPARTFRFDGEVVDVWIRDVDDDGRPDLVVPVTAPVARVAALRLVATGATTVACHIFANTGPGKDPDAVPFGEKADAVRALPVKIRLHLDRFGRVLTTRKMLIEFAGDFSGDGRPDLVHCPGGNRLEFHVGTADGFFREDAWLRVKVPDLKDAETLHGEVVDLDDDGRDDLLIRCRTRDGKGDRVILLLARGGKK